MNERCAVVRIEADNVAGGIGLRWLARVVRQVAYALLRQGGRGRLIGALAAPLLLLAAVLARAEVADSGGPVHLVGPMAMEEMFRELASGAGIRTDSGGLVYLRIDSAPAAAGALAGGRAEAMFSLGRVAERELGPNLPRWRAVEALEHVIAVRAVAIAVHPRNPVESLSLEQLAAIYSGRAAQWSVVGGQAGGGQVRRYGLPPGDPLTLLFHEKVLEGASPAMTVRRPGSAEVLAALESDPLGIAYLDAVTAVAAGDAIRIVAIGAAGRAVAPNAQSLADGSYVLGEPLMMYVSPRAGSVAGELPRFILSGGGDATLRRHGFMPTLRQVQPGPLSSFQSLYGERIRRVQAASDSGGKVALAHQMVQSARTIPHDAGLIAAMCEAAYELAAVAAADANNPRPGRAYVAAFEALRVLSDRVPDKEFDCAVKHAALYRQGYEAGGLRLEGEHLVGSLIRAAEIGSRVGRHAEAARLWRSAAAKAEENSSPRLTAIRSRQSAFDARERSSEEAERLAEALRASPHDSILRYRMLMLRLIELDEPAEAARYLDVADDESVKTHLPLAAQPIERTSATAALALAEWYAGLMDQAEVGGAELMAARSKGYYLRFFELHENHEDEQASRAAVGIRRVGGEAPARPDAGSRPRPRPRPQPNPPLVRVTQRGDVLTDLKFAEFSAANPDLVHLTREELSVIRHVTDLSALTRLGRLTQLELRQANSVTDLSPLAELANLNTLTLTGLTLDDVSPLAKLLRLTTLDLSEARPLADLTPLSRLTSLRTLVLVDCTAITDLTALGELRSLTTLNLRNCGGVDSLAALENLTRLRTLDVRRTAVKADEVQQLQQKLPNTRIHFP